MINWFKNPPKNNTWVWGRYKSEEWLLVKVCKTGCCIFSDGNTMILPDFWMEASDEEAQAEQERCNAIVSFNTWDLYDPS